MLPVEGRTIRSLRILRREGHHWVTSLGCDAVRIVSCHIALRNPGDPTDNVLLDEVEYVDVTERSVLRGENTLKENGLHGHLRGYRE